MKVLNVTPEQFEQVLDGKASLTLDQLIDRQVLLRMTASGVTITPESALKSPTVFAIVNALSRIVASLPFGVVLDTSTPERQMRALQKDHAVTKLLNRRPNKWQTRFDYWALVMMRLLLWGNYFALKNHNSKKQVISLTPIHPDKVTVKLDRRQRVMFQVSGFDGLENEIGLDRMHWIRSGVTFEGLRGVSPIKQINESIAMEIAAEKFGGTVFGNGAIPNIILTRKGAFSGDESRSNFKRMWDAAFKRKRGTAVLEGDEWKVEVVQLTNEESQFLETRELQRSVIAGAFGVPPHIVGDLKRATFSNISNQTLELLMFTLAPWLENIERAVERDYLTEAELDSGLFAQFDTKRLLRGDPKSMSEMISKLRQWGILSANEGRSMLEMDARPDDEGDDFLTPLNFTADGDDADDSAGLDDDELDEVRRGLRAVD